MMIMDNNNIIYNKYEESVVVACERFRGRGWKCCRLRLLAKRCDHGPHDLVAAFFGRLGFAVELHEVANPTHGQLVIVVGEWRERILEHVGSVR